MKYIYYPMVHRPQEEIDTLHNRYKIFDTLTIPFIFKSALHVDVVKWTKPTTASRSHILYYVTVKQQKRPFVLRANLGISRNIETYLLIEKLVTDKAASIGVPVNKILHVDISRKIVPYEYQIQEMLEGQDIEDHFHGSVKEYDQLSFEIGMYVAIMSSIQFDKFGCFDAKKAIKNQLDGVQNSNYDYITTCLDEDIKFLVDNNLIHFPLGEKIFSLFETYKPVIEIKKGSLVQHDLADHNMFFKDNHITGIFDWEACVSSDPFLDIASSPTWKTHYPREKKLIEGFTSIKKLPDFFEEKMNIYRLRTSLWKSVFAIRSKIMNGARRQRLFDALTPFKLA